MNPALRSVANCIFYNYGMDGYLGLVKFTILSLLELNNFKITNM